jgi:hypothetical protein
MRVPGKLKARKLKALASRLWRPTTPFALALLVVGGLGVYWGRHDSLRTWGPNIAVGAFALAATITIVEWIVRNETRRRLKPRTEQVISRMRFDLMSIIEAIVTDYSGTHVDTFRGIPEDPMAMIDQWLADQDREDQERQPLPGDSYPMLILEGMEFLRQLEIARSRDRDVMEPEVVAVIDDMSWHVGKARMFYGFAENDLGDPERSKRRAVRLIVEGTKKFVDVFVRLHGPTRDILPLTKAAAKEQSEKTRR